VDEDKTNADVPKGQPGIELDILKENGEAYVYLGDLYIATPNKENNIKVRLSAQPFGGMELSSCNFTHKYVVDDSQGEVREKALESSESQILTAIDGDHAVSVVCGDYMNSFAFRVADRQPEMCRDSTFEKTEVTASSVEEINNIVIGAWEGCVKTPWVPVYFVTIEFRRDGTYSANSNEVLDGVKMNAMYYGTEEDNSDKKYLIDSVDSAGIARGDLVIYFAESATKTTGRLEKVRVIGNKLSFEYYHRGTYGPLTFELYKK